MPGWPDPAAARRRCRPAPGRLVAVSAQVQALPSPLGVGRRTSRPTRRCHATARGRTPGGRRGRGARDPRPRIRPADRSSRRRARAGRPSGASTSPTAGRGLDPPRARGCRRSRPRDRQLLTVRGPSARAARMAAAASTSGAFPVSRSGPAAPIPGGAGGRPSRTARTRARRPCGSSSASASPG